MFLSFPWITSNDLSWLYLFGQSKNMNKNKHIDGKYKQIIKKLSTNIDMIFNIILYFQ